jgi:colanic acid/amylovoran biosynthesis glycosyltransferase
MGWRAERPLPYHWIYFFEACVVARWILESGAEHLHAHFGSNSAEVAMLAGLLADKPYSFTAHGTVETDQSKFIGLGEKIRRAAFVVAVSSFGRSQLYRWVAQEHWSKIRVVRCGLETAFHEGCSLEPADVPKLVCVGRLCSEKGQLLLLAALRRVIDTGQPCELVLAGDGEMRDDVESLRDELNLGPHVRITGWISGDQVRREIVNARALVLPSFAEGLPVVIMEAMALARPVISTYVGGIPELVKDQETGWLVPAGELDALVSALSACLDATPARLKEMGASGRERVLGLHDVDQQAEQLANEFSQSGAPCRRGSSH